MELVMKTIPSSESHQTPGRKPVLELLASQPEILDTVFIADGMENLGEIIGRCRENNVRFRKVNRAELDRMFPGNHQGVVARIRARRFVDLDELIGQDGKAAFPLILALDQVQDPGNVGTLARSLYALGGIGLVFPKDRAAFIGHGAAKAAAGALDQLPLCQVVNLARAIDSLNNAGYWIYGTGMSQKSAPLFSTQLSFPAVLVLGNEDKGMREGIAKRCHAILSIPMARGFDSLNVAQAGAMVMSEMLRQHAQHNTTI